MTSESQQDWGRINWEKADVMLFASYSKTTEYKMEISLCSFYLKFYPEKLTDFILALQRITDHLTTQYCQDILPKITTAWRYAYSETNNVTWGNDNISVTEKEKTPLKG